MSMYWPSQSATHVWSYRRIRRRTLASLKPRSLRRWRAIRDRLNSMSPVLIALGDAVERPDRRPVAPLAVAVLDVVVDEAEVVAELDRRRAGQRALVVAGDRRVGEEAEERPHPLAGRRPRAVEAEVVADHRVHARGGVVVVADEAEDLLLGVGDQDGRLEDRLGRWSSPAMVAGFGQTCESAGSVLREPGRRPPMRRRAGKDAGSGDASAPASAGWYATEARSDQPGRWGGRAGAARSGRQRRSAERGGATVRACRSRADTRPMRSSSPASTTARPTGS